MHWLDRLARLGLSRLPPHKRVFHEGWGDEADIAWYLGVAGTAPPMARIEPRIGPATDGDGLETRDLVFESPAERLPEESRLARARVVGPAGGSQRHCVLMASWNDEDYRTRTRIAGLLAPHGITSVIPMHPFYGDRRVAPPKHQAIATVAEFGIMGRAAVVEGLALARWLGSQGHAVGVSGYSMGGNLAGFVAAMSPEPIAAAPLGAAYSPASPFIDGALRLAVDWEALGGEERDEELRSYLLSASVLQHPAPPHTATAVLVAATTDGYVPAASVLAIHRHWPGSEMVWVNTGHGALLRKHTHRLTDGVARSFERFESWRGA